MIEDQFSTRASVFFFSPLHSDWLWGPPSLLLRVSVANGSERQDKNHPLHLVLSLRTRLLRPAHLTIICRKQNGLLSQVVDTVLLGGRNQNVNLSLKMLAQVLLGQVLSSCQCKWTAKNMTSNFVENQELIQVQCLLRRSCGRESPEVIVLTTVLFVTFDDLLLFFLIVQLCRPSVRHKELHYFIHRKQCVWSQHYIPAAQLIVCVEFQLIILIYLSNLSICLSIYPFVCNSAATRERSDVTTTMRLLASVTVMAATVWHNSASSVFVSSTPAYCLFEESCRVIAR
jgi:hypothetical protein